jgi:hypothetical protein
MKWSAAAPSSTGHPGSGVSTSPTAAPTWIKNIQNRMDPSPGVARHQGCFQGACFARSAASSGGSRTD